MHLVNFDKNSSTFEPVIQDKVTIESLILLICFKSSVLIKSILFKTISFFIDDLISIKFFKCFSICSVKFSCIDKLLMSITRIRTSQLVAL